MPKLESRPSDQGSGRTCLTLRRCPRCFKDVGVSPHRLGEDLEQNQIKSKDLNSRRLAFVLGIISLDVPLNVVAEEDVLLPFQVTNSLALGLPVGVENLELAVFNCASD